jgi:hypothetical protein
VLNVGFAKGREAAFANLCAKSFEACMAQMDVSIPAMLKSWAQARVAEARYSSTSDCVRDLVRRDQEAEAPAAACRRRSTRG